MAARGQPDPRLEPVAIPPCVAALWETFQVLAACRRSGMAAQPLCLADLEAWCRLNRVQLSSWEIETLIVVDSAALAAAHRKLE